MMTRALVIPPRPLFEEADSPMAASEGTPITLDGRSGQSGKMGKGRGGVQNMRPNGAQGQDISVWEIKSSLYNCSHASKRRLLKCRDPEDRYAFLGDPHDYVTAWDSFKLV